MKKLGLDLSTVTAGYCISENKKIINCGFIDISKVKKYKEKAKLIIDYLKDKEFDIIIIEESLSGFQYGRSSIQTIIKLAQNKAVIGYILEENFQKPVYYVNATTLRKDLFGISREKGINPKEFVKKNIEKMFNITPWIKYNKINNIDMRMKDVYDAIVASCYEIKM